MEISAANRYFSGFCETLRQEGINVLSSGTSSYLQAVTFINLEKLDDLYWAGRAILINHIKDVPTYDAAFENYFHRQGRDNLSIGSGEEESEPSEDDQPTVESILGQDEMHNFDLVDGGGSSRQAASGEALIEKSMKLTNQTERDFISKIETLVKRMTPSKVTRRYLLSKTGKKIDLGSSIRQVLKTDGEMIKLIRKTRKKSHAPVLILIDVSGSMAMQIRPSLLLAFAMTKAFSRCESFCLGTRLTHITEALKVKDVDLAIAQISSQVLDWEGGTRLGEGVYSFLSKSRYRSFTRGADIFIISDGLERGSPDLLVECVQRLSMNGRRLRWLSPLASHPEYKPETRGMKSIASICGTIYPVATLDDIRNTLARIWWPKPISSQVTRHFHE